MKKRVVVGLSGGVDSSVAAYLLKEQGYEVIGMFMRNWHDETVTLDNECAWIDDSRDALLVAEKLGIPYHVIDLSKAYFERIVEYMFDEYQKGRTPNPDVLCNREIKFDLFLEAALQLGADFVATGHYCRKEAIEKDGKQIHRLLAGLDKNKDQSYFLCQVSQEQLSRALFPVGGLQKSEVRKIAEEQELITAKKKDSQGLCFIGKVSLPEFLQQKLKPKAGKIIEVEADKLIDFRTDSTDLDLMAQPWKYDINSGKVNGNHNGAHYFTVGQRKGFSKGGTAKPLFVLYTDTSSNIVYAGQGEDHPGLYRPALKMENSSINWIRTDLIPAENEMINFMCRIRYRQPLEKMTLIRKGNWTYILFDQPQKSITPGQFAAWYLNDELVGSGVIFA